MPRFEVHPPYYLTELLTAVVGILVTVGSNTRSCCSFYNMGSGGRFKNTYELLNLRALKYSPVNKIHIFQCVGKIFRVEFQRYPLKFHTKYLTHTLKGMIFIQH